MKKFICLLVVLCALLCCLTACGDTVSFESEDSLMAHLNGMWTLQIGDRYPDYYIFQDGKAYRFGDAFFVSATEALMDTTLEQYGLDSLVALTFGDAVNAALADYTGNPIEHFGVEHKKGTFRFNANNSTKKIVVKKDAVVFIDSDESEYPLTKVADSADFNGEHFEELFIKTRNEYSISCESFLMPVEDYAEYLLERQLELRKWTLSVDSGNYKIYAPIGSTNFEENALHYTDSVLALKRGWNAYRNCAAYSLFYSPTPFGDQNHLVIHDVAGTSIGTLLVEVSHILSGFPGAISYPELYELCENRSIDQTINDIRYVVEYGNGTLIKITFPATISLSNYPLNEAPTKKLYNVLDCSTVWADNNNAGWPLYFAFEEDGTCYYALYNYSELFFAGKGTYTIYDNGTLLMDFNEGDTDTNTYTFDTTFRTLKPAKIGRFGRNYHTLTKSDTNFEDFKSTIEKHISLNGSTGESGFAETLDTNKLLGVLDYDTAWQAAYYYSSEDYSVWFGFEENGKCYYILGDMEILDGGKGTYTLKDDTTIVMKIKSSGKTYTDTYTFDAASKTLTLQKKGMLGKAGTQFVLGPSSELDFEKLKEVGGRLAS